MSDPWPKTVRQPYELSTRKTPPLTYYTYYMFFYGKLGIFCSLSSCQLRGAFPKSGMLSARYLHKMILEREVS